MSTSAHLDRPAAIWTIGHSTRSIEEFLSLIRDGSVDILFANAGEMHSLYQTADFDMALALVRKDAKLAAVTVGGDGAFVASRDAIEMVPSRPVDTLVDTTGAGDLFASAFLYALARDLPHATCAAFGHLAGAEVISHIGPRPATSLRELAEQSGLPAEGRQPAIGGGCLVQAAAIGSRRARLAARCEIAQFLLADGGAWRL